MLSQDPTVQPFDVTHELAMQQAQGRFAGDKNLMVQFHILPMMDANKSREEGRPIYRDVEHVRILIPGSKESVVDKPVTEIERARFKDLYEKWKANEQIDVTGTPLETCTWISRSLVEEMKYFNVRTVEQLATMSDTHAQKFPGITKYKDLANAYLAQAEKGKAAADLAAAMETKDRQIADLTEMVKGLQQTLAQLQTNLGAQQAPAPRRRAKATA